MKKLHVVLIVLAVLCVAFIGAIQIAPSLARHYIVEHSEELIGRKMKIADISFFPSTFTITVDTLVVYEPDGVHPFVSFEKFKINANPTRLLFKDISISEFYLKGLFVRVQQDGDVFNFSDILEKFAPDSTAKDTLSQIPQTDGDSAQVLDFNPTEALGGFSLSIENIKFRKGFLIYEDKKIHSKISIDDISLAIPAVYFSNEDTDIGVKLNFAKGGVLNIKTLFNMQTQGFNTKVNIDKLSLSPIKPYLNDFINYKDFDGCLGANLFIAGNLKSILSSKVSGNIELDKIKLTETNDNALGVSHIDVGISRASLSKMDFRVDSVIVDGAYAHLDLLKNGKTNIDALLEPLSKNETAKDSATTASDSTTTEAPAETQAEATAAETSKPLKFTVRKLQVANTTVSATDHTPKQPFNYKVSNIAVSGYNINFDTPCTIDVSAAFPEGGSVKLKYKGALSDLSTMEAYVHVKNLALKHFSPYSHHYTGYPISSGTMAFASENRMSGFNIESKNTIDIYNIDVGDKDANTKPEYTVPMKVGLYILKDKDDRIEFDVPVKGNVKDPEFSYLKIVWKTVMNLLIKVAISPLKIVGNVATTGANAVGLNLGQDDEITIDPLARSFSSEQYAKAQKMVEALAKDPKLKLNFVQNFNLKKTVDAYRTRKLKTEFYKARENKAALNEFDEKAIVEIPDKDSAYVAYASAHEKEMDRKTLEKEVLAMADARNQELLKVLQQQPGVTRKNLTVTTAPRGALTRKKALYKVQIDME